MSTPTAPSPGEPIKPNTSMADSQPVDAIANDARDQANPPPVVHVGGMGQLNKTGKDIGLVIKKLWKYTPTTLAAVALAGVLYGIISWFYDFKSQMTDLRAQVAALDPKIDAKIAGKSDDLRKEIIGESRRIKDDLELLTGSLEFEQRIREITCSGSYELTIQLYLEYVKSIAPKDFPVLIRNKIYIQIIESIYMSGNYGVLGESELDKIDSILRQDITLCGSGSMQRLGLLYAANGKYEKARMALLNSIGTLLKAKETKDIRYLLSFSYASMLLIDICQQQNDMVDIRERQSWDFLKELQRRYLVANDSIASQFDDTGIGRIMSHITLAKGSQSSDILGRVIAKLRKIQFEIVNERTDTPKGTIIESKLVEIPVAPPAKPQPPPKNSPDC